LGDEDDQQPSGLNLPDTGKRYPLPIQADGETVDVDLMKLRDYPGEDIIPFPEWCKNQQITAEMIKSKLFFGLNDEFFKLKRDDRNYAISIYQIWVATFPTHSMAFDHWIKLPKTPKLPRKMIKLSTDHTIDLTEWHLKAYEIAEQAARQDRIKFHKLRQIWSQSLFRSHYMDFSKWLDSPHRPIDSNIQLTSNEESRMYTVADIRRFDKMFQHSDSSAIRDKIRQSDFILDNEVRKVLDSPEHQLSPDLFLPTGILAKVHVPNYIHVPHGVSSFFHMDPSKMSNHAQHLIWSKLHDAQYATYERDPEAWNMYFNNHTDLHKTPLIVRHLNQDHCQKPIMSVRQVVQQIQAHERCRIAGGPQNLDKDKFYDLFIRPLEFMASRGMPLHSCLISGIHSFSARCNLARQLIETAGFSIYDPLPITPHYIFSEVSKIRHLESHTLLPQDTGYLIPIARLENMPRITNIFQTKRMQGKVDIKDFEPHGKLHNFQPNHFIPLPEHILNMFKELGGPDMPLCDHVALNHKIIRHHRLYVHPPVPKPRNAPRKAAQTKQSSSSSSATSSSSESGATKSKQMRNKSIDSPSLLKKQHNREETALRKPKQTSQGSPKPKSPKQMHPPPSALQQTGPDLIQLEQDFVPQLPTIIDPATGTLMPQVARHPSDAKIQMTVTQLNQMLQARHMHARTSQKRSMDTSHTTKSPIASTSLFQHQPATTPMNSAFETTDWFDTLTLTQSPSQIPSLQISQTPSATYTSSLILPTGHNHNLHLQQLILFQAIIRL